jgi:hypothetical protein
MSCFEPCPACKRHVTTDETVCPFCAAPLPDCSQKVKRTPLKGRLSRAALLAVGAGAALISSSCAGSAYGLPTTGSGGTSMSDGSTNGDGSGGASGSGGAGGAVALYGAPAPAASEQPAAAPADPDPTPKSAKS